MSGKTGTTQLSFTLAAAETERQASITLTATGYVEGIPVTKKASITVKQNEGGTTTVETNVKGPAIDWISRWTTRVERPMQRRSPSRW